MDFVNCNFIGEETSFVLPNDIEVLDMYGCQLSSLPCLSRLQRLQERGIFSCSVEWLLLIGDNTTITSLPSIQFLCLRELPSFRGLCKGVLLPGSFACLRRLTVHECHVLENLMSLELFQHLQCLEQIDIAECSEMEEVIQGGEKAMVEEEGYNSINNNTILLPNLRSFHLVDLGKLKSICKEVIICPSLNRIVIQGCPRLKKIPLSLGNSTSVKEGEIEGSKEWWDALAWDDPNTKTLLPFFKVGGRGMKRRAEEESEEVASTSRQPLSPH
ncbi:disease resistance protein RPS2-like [Magnolia sinica]|uniref:disease resistance protein RPS2-like n=1 Tax=Magnolia sinica TaxID=86752 RepID=UPI002659EA11|nr:disease resistance protein RPS2-like [Magnolia sinica]